MKPSFTPIVISTFRPSFADLQVGDQVLNHRGSFPARWDALTVSKVTDTQFVAGMHRFRRDDGAEIGNRFHNATLPTPERLAEINADAEERAIRMTLRDVDLSKLPLDTARQVLALIEAVQPN